MEFLADTVALVRYWSDSGRIGTTARKVLEAADRNENTIYISIISLAEILYLSQKNRIPIDLEKTVEIISNTNNFQIVDLDTEVIAQAQQVHGLELHDRLIVATARMLGVPMITSDKLISESELVNIVWN